MRFIWLHGFASGPQSKKGLYLRARLEERGAHLVIPDLNLPRFFGLTVTRMLGQIDELAQGEGQVVLFGSSLGGYTAATWAATQPRRTAALVLLAPAFDLASRWTSRMEQEKLAQWRRTGRLPFDHFASGKQEDLSVRFLEDAALHAAFPLPEAKTLVLQGTRDDVVAPALAREFTERMQGRARLVELDDGHELAADLPRLWQEIEPHVEPFLLQR
jgi:pimeloyl-ACP methyl ester carboxylesterase